MKYQKMRLIDAHAYVKQKRPLIRPNSGFWKDLVDFEKKLFHKNTINMVESKVGGYICTCMYFYYLAVITAWGPYGRILTKAVSTDQTQWNWEENKRKILMVNIFVF